MQREWPPIEATQAANIKRTAGAKLSKREAVKNYVWETWPDGRVPHNVKNESLAAAVGVHEKTVRRALLEMGQNTDR